MMLTILCLFGFLAFSQAGILKFDPRIVNGENAQEGEIPYQVSLQYTNKTHFCGGSILDKKYVLTAAHCVESKYPNQIRIAAGIINLKTAVNYHNVGRIIRHENYNHTDSLINDIALLEIYPSFTFSSNIQTVSLPPSHLIIETGDTAVVSGWGSLAENGKTTDILKKADIRISDQEYCYFTYDSIRMKIYDEQICAFMPNIERGPCKGDGGGPLVIKYLWKTYLIGIVSWSKGCADMKYPTVFTRIDKYRDWIYPYYSGSKNFVAPEL